MPARLAAACLAASVQHATSCTGHWFCSHIGLLSSCGNGVGRPDRGAHVRWADAICMTFVQASLSPHFLPHDLVLTGRFSLILVSRFLAACSQWLIRRLAALGARLRTTYLQGIYNTISYGHYEFMCSVFVIPKLWTSMWIMVKVLMTRCVALNYSITIVLLRWLEWSGIDGFEEKCSSNIEWVHEHACRYILLQNQLCEI